MYVEDHFSQKLNDREKASWFSDVMVYNCVQIILNVRSGYKSFNDIAALPKMEDYFKAPRCPRLQLQHVEIAKVLIETFKDDKFVRYENEDAPTCSFFPIIQSGGSYNLSFDSGSDANYFRDDVIIFCFGIKYKNHCSNIMRTFIAMPKENDDVKDNYNFLLQIQKNIIETLRDGVMLKKVYEETINFVKNSKPQLLQYLTDNFGSATGAEPRDELLEIRAESKGIAEENMIFNVNVGFHAIYDANLMERPPHTYSLWIGDDVKVEKGKAATLLSHSDNLKLPEFAIMQGERQVHPLEMPDIKIE